MLYRISWVLCFIFVVSGESIAQVNIDTGLFVKPDIATEQSNIDLSFSGNLQDDTGSAGVSLRVGSFIFGFESIKTGSHFNSSSSYSASDGTNISANFSSVSGPQHRAMMGFKLSRNIAIYGFHGIASTRQNHNLSYGYSHTEEEVRYEKLFYCNGIGFYDYATGPVTYSSFGEGQFDFSNLQNTIGAGAEALLLGGVLRVEYNMTFRKGYNQSVKLHHSTSVTEVSNNNTQDSYQFHKGASTEQLLQLRWKASF